MDKNITMSSQDSIINLEMKINKNIDKEANLDNLLKNDNIFGVLASNPNVIIDKEAIISSGRIDSKHKNCTLEDLLNIPSISNVLLGSPYLHIDSDYLNKLGIIRKSKQDVLKILFYYSKIKQWLLFEFTANGVDKNFVGGYVTVKGSAYYSSLNKIRLDTIWITKIILIDKQNKYKIVYVNNEYYPPNVCHLCRYYKNNKCNYIKIPLICDNFNDINKKDSI